MNKLLFQQYYESNNIRDFLKGTSFRYNFEWTSTNYYFNDEFTVDFVSYNGALYACKISNTNIIPTDQEYWQFVMSGQIGPKGEVGTIFTPNLDNDGNLSWKNDAGLPNPPTINIKGEKGERGIQGEKGEAGIQGIKGNTGERGVQGIQGKGLEFQWFGTTLGVRQEGEKDYIISENLRGLQGLQGLQGPKGNTGEKGPKGDRGDIGPRGAGIIIRKFMTPDHNEILRYAYDDVPDDKKIWTDVADLKDLRGKDIFLGRNETTGDIEWWYENDELNKIILVHKENIIGPKGDSIIKTYVGNDGYLYIQMWNEEQNKTVLRRAGYVRGDKGDDGRQVILRVDNDRNLDIGESGTGTHLQWKYAGDEYKLWTNLIQINELFTIAIAGLTLEQDVVERPDEEGKMLKYNRIMLSSYKIEYDENDNLIRTDKIATVSSVEFPIPNVLTNVYYDSKSKELIIITENNSWNIDVTEFFRAGKGIEFINKNDITINVDELFELINESIVEGTYDEIMNLANNKQLIPGRKYVINDFQTIYYSNGASHSTTTIGIGEYSDTITTAFGSNLILGDNVKLGVDGLPHPSVIYSIELTARSPSEFEFEARINKPNSLMPDPTRFKIWYNPIAYRNVFGENHKGIIFKMEVPDRNISLPFDFMNQIWWRSAALLNLYGIPATEGRYFHTFNVNIDGEIIQCPIDLIDTVIIESNFGVDDISTNRLIRGGSSIVLTNNAYSRYNGGNNVFIGSNPSTDTSNVSMVFSDIKFGPGCYDNNLISYSPNVWGDVWGVKFGNLCRYQTMVANSNAGAGISKIRVGHHCGTAITMIARNGSVASVNIGEWNGLTKIESKNGGIQGINIDSNDCVIKAEGNITDLHVNRLRYVYMDVKGNLTRFIGNILYGSSVKNIPILINGNLNFTTIEKMNEGSSIICDSSLIESNIGFLNKSNIKGSSSMQRSNFNGTITNLNLEMNNLQNLDVSGFYAENPFTLKGNFSGELIMRNKIDNREEILDLDLYSDIMTMFNIKRLSYIGPDPIMNYSRFSCEYFDEETQTTQTKILICT